MIRTLTALLILCGGAFYLFQFGLHYPEEEEDPSHESRIAAARLEAKPEPNTLEQALERYLESLPPEIPQRFRFQIPRSGELGLELERARLRRGTSEEPILQVTAPVGEVDREALFLGWEGELPLELAARPVSLHAEVTLPGSPDEVLLRFWPTGLSGEPFPDGRERLERGRTYEIALHWEGGHSPRRPFHIATLEDRRHLESALTALRTLRNDRYRMLLEIHLHRALGRTSEAYRLVENAQKTFPDDPHRRMLDDVLRATLDLPPRILDLRNR